MTKTAQIGPRINVDLKECFNRHIDRVDSTLGDEVDKALRTWLAIHYLINEDDRDELPDEDRELIKKAIAKQSYEISRACKNLEDTHRPAGGAQVDDRASPEDLDEIIDDKQIDALQELLDQLASGNESTSRNGQIKS